MTLIAWDTETDRFRPGVMAPPLVCLQYQTPGERPGILNWRPAVQFFIRMLESGWLTVGHGVDYDMIVMMQAGIDLGLDLGPLIFRAYRENRVDDTELRQKLADIGRGRYRTRQYNLGAVAAMNGYPGVNKEDPWRLNYGQLRDIPVESWPEDALYYALNDPSATLHAYLAQQAKYDPALLVNSLAQARKYFSLKLCSNWGLRTSPRGVKSLEDGVRERLAEITEWLQEEGLVRENGSRDTKRAKARLVESYQEQGLTVPLTDTGKDHVKILESQGYSTDQAIDSAIAKWYVSTDSDACKSSGDPLLETYSEFSALQKVLSNDVEALRGGIEYPIHTNFDLAETGRVTSSSPNVQNPRRLAGVRECYVPRNDQGTYQTHHSPIR